MLIFTYNEIDLSEIVLLPKYMLLKTLPMERIIHKMWFANIRIKGAYQIYPDF